MKTLKDIKNHLAVLDAFKDTDGYWIQLKNDYINSKSKLDIIYGKKITDCIIQLNDLESTEPVNLKQQS